MKMCRCNNCGSLIDLDSNKNVCEVKGYNKRDIDMIVCSEKCAKELTENLIYEHLKRVEELKQQDFFKDKDVNKDVEETRKDKLLKIMESVSEIRNVMQDINHFKCDKNICPLFDLCEDNYLSGGFGLCELFHKIVEEVEISVEKEEN